MLFDKYNIHPAIQLGLVDLGYESLLEVQEACLEPIRSGRDLSVRSKTGTGKTSAFGIPLLEKIDPERKRPEVLILAPTRELADQIANELATIGSHRKIKVLAAYGGAPINEQIRSLRKGVQVVVGTPGRLIDLTKRKELSLKEIRVVVLDEADEMLSMGFFEDVTGLMDKCKSCQQVIILSASLDKDTESLIDRYTSEVVRIDLSTDTLSVEGIDHFYYKISDDLPKHHYLLHVLKNEKPKSAIVFANTRKDASLVTTHLAREGYKAEMISGELPQTERKRVMDCIRRNDLHILVATDLAARGIDIYHLSHVINFSLPEDPQVYLHRIGRTGRVGRHGVAISLVSDSLLRTLGLLERQYKIKFEERKFPTKKEMVNQRCELLIDDLVKEAEYAICDGYLAQAAAVLEHKSARQVVAYMLKKRADEIHDSQRTKANQPPPQRPGRPSSRQNPKHTHKRRK